MTQGLKGARGPAWIAGPDVPAKDRLGTLVGGVYRLDTVLGEGATGVTYNAWHVRQKAPYAVKILRRSLEPTQEQLLRLRRDLRLLASLKDRGILAPAFGLSHDGSAFLANGLVVGETLRQRLARGPLGVLGALAVISGCGRALSRAHRAGVLHGDLRPENIFLRSTGQPVLIGAAEHHLRKIDPSVSVLASAPPNRLLYLPPERLGGEASGPTPEAEVYALGIILYECLTGKRAFLSATMEEFLNALSQPLPSVALPEGDGAPARISAALDRVIAAACASSGGECITTMDELVDALARACACTGLALPEPGEPAEGAEASRLTPAGKRASASRPCEGDAVPRAEAEVVSGPVPEPLRQERPDALAARRVRATSRLREIRDAMPMARTPAQPAPESLAKTPPPAAPSPEPSALPPPPAGPLDPPEPLTPLSAEDPALISPAPEPRRPAPAPKVLIAAEAEAPPDRLSSIDIVVEEIPAPAPAAPRSQPPTMKLSRVREADPARQDAPPALEGARRVRLDLFSVSGFLLLTATVLLSTIVGTLIASQMWQHGASSPASAPPPAEVRPAPPSAPVVPRPDRPEQVAAPAPPEPQPEPAKQAPAPPEPQPDQVAAPAPPEPQPEPAKQAPARPAPSAGSYIKKWDSPYTLPENRNVLRDPYKRKKAR